MEVCDAEFLGLLIGLVVLNEMEEKYIYIMGGKKKERKKEKGESLTSEL